MSDVTINYKGNAIATMDASGTKTLLTKGRYCEDDIEVAYGKPGGGGYTEDEWMNRTVTSVTTSQTSFSLGLDGFSELVSFSAPNLTSLYNANYFFRNCSKLESVNLPALIKMYGMNMFENTKLQYLVLPNFSNEPIATQSRFGGNNFKNVTTLKAIDCFAIQLVQATAFSAASSFNTLIIRNRTSLTESGQYVLKIASLENVNAFNGTPFASGGAGGTLYVPSADISEYEAATNWSTILGYTNNQIQAIEGSIYETQYADGTPIT